MRKILTFAVALVLAAIPVFAQGQMQQLPNDPAVRKGQLDNGLTYYIMHNEKPADRAEFYLATNVGAIQETPDQDGLAHFLEHMCFNGTKNFPGKALLDWLQSIGASFGGNVNASTGIDQTQYMLTNIPLVRQSVVDTCLLILHDYSHFVTNDPVEIDKERPVIIEERRSRRNAQWRTFERSLPYLYGDSKYSTCTLIGSQENLENFKPESLVNFYKTWYRPDMQAVIVVGDVDVDYVEAKIKSTWADIPKAVNPKAKDKITLTEFAEPRVAVLTDPETTSCSVELAWETDARDESMNNTVPGMLVDLITNITSRVMGERFNDITSKPDASFLSGSFGYGSLCEAFEAAFGDVTLKEDNILGGFKDYCLQLEKMKKYGFTEAEVQRAKDGIISRYEKRAAEASSRKNPEFVYPLIRNFFDNHAYMEPQAELELVKGLLGQVNAQLLNQVVPQFITDNNLVVIYSGPQKDGIATPSAQQLLQVMEEVKGAEIEAPVEESLDVALLNPETLAGSPVKKTAKSRYGSTEWTLGNGVKVVVLPTDYKKDQILFNLFKAGGESLIPTSEMASFDSNIYGMFENNQGVAGFKGTDLGKMLTGKNISVNPYIGNMFSGVSGNSSVKDLETAFQLLYLEYVEPRFDPEEWNTAVSQLKSMLPNLEKNPQMIFNKEMTKVLYGDDPRREFISMEKIDKADLATVEKNYRNIFADAKDAVMVITGDVDLETLQPLVEKYIGSLPAGKKATQWTDMGPHFVKGNVNEFIKTDMETPLCTVIQVYTDYSPYTVYGDVMTQAVSYVLDQIYVDTMREDEGGTYGASSASASMKAPEERTILQVVFQCKPSMVNKLRNIAVDEFVKLATNGPTDEQLTRTVENFKKNVPENRINNSYWMNNLVRYYQFGGGDYDKEYEAAVNAITKESIREAAWKLVHSGNFIDFVQVPGKSTERE